MSQDPNLCPPERPSPRGYAWARVLAPLAIPAVVAVHLVLADRIGSFFRPIPLLGVPVWVVLLLIVGPLVALATVELEPVEASRDLRQMRTLRRWLADPGAPGWRRRASVIGLGAAGLFAWWWLRFV
ncbi:MAG: hypothetical protein H6736_24760 [Alphaproteobacteria bacterium]|nr:hypothetical protein [Alphaproteobacteria bacterium]